MRRLEASLPGGRRLARIDAEPWHDLDAPPFDRLARAELERLGLPRAL